MSDMPRVILDFVGGSEDGTRYEGALANVYYWQADHARLGARFRLIPDARFRDQLVRGDTTFDRSHYEIYEVIERHDEWDGVHVVARYLGRENSVSVDSERGRQPPGATGSASADR